MSSRYYGRQASEDLDVTEEDSEEIRGGTETRQPGGGKEGVKLDKSNGSGTMSD